jgi:hypothetical protein
MRKAVEAERKRFCVLQVSDGCFCVGDVEIGVVLGVYKTKHFAKRRAKALERRHKLKRVRT